MAGKLTEAQRRAVALAARQPNGLTKGHAERYGHRIPTYDALVSKGLFERVEARFHSTHWRITDAGRAALREDSAQADQETVS